MLGNFGPWSLEILDATTGIPVSSAVNVTNHQFSSLPGGIYQIIIYQIPQYQILLYGPLLIHHIS